MSKIEILAPAGCPSALKTAINNGANAVYLGLQDFNARISADNFTTQNIGEYVRYAHLFGVKVFLTVNTLVNNEEMDKLLQTVKAAVDAKVDAYLVQDLGVAYVLKNAFPNICLHASTQLGVHNLAGAKVAQSLGFSRVVLSREAKLEDIKEIKQNTNLEIEYFVQGALCIAFSGNCYFSGMMQDNSGNRGRCKQYCRMKYSSNQNEENNHEKYLLSARDLCLLPNLKTLIDAGVTSFKIEGRLRRDGYVAQATKTYADVLKILEQNKQIDIEAESFKLKKVFSRGEFNNNAYLFDGAPDNVVNKDVQNHFGIEIGKVLKVERFKDLQKVTLKSTHKLHEGDGLKFLDGKTQVCSLGVGNVETKGNNTYVIYTKHKLKVGYLVNLILDSVSEQKLLENEKKLPIKFEIVALKNQPFVCKVFYDNLSTEFCSDEILEPAKNCPTTKEEMFAQFSKLGDTEFMLKDCNIKTDGVFVAKSLLNKYRRIAIEKIKDCIVLNNEQKIVAKFDKKSYEKALIDIKNVKEEKSLPNILVFNEDNFDDVLKHREQLKNLLLIFAPKNFTKNNIEEKLSKLNGLNMGLNLPIIANYKDLKIIDSILSNNKNLWVVSNNIYGLSYLKTHRVIAGPCMNSFNDIAISHLKQLGVCGVVVSYEQQIDRINQQNNVFAYTLGFVPLMTFAHCPYKTINDGTCKKCTFKEGLEFCDISSQNFRIRRTVVSQCYFELLNATLVNAIGYLSGNQFFDARELKLEGVLDAILKNKKIKLSQHESLGKLFNAVN